MHTLRSSTQPTTATTQASTQKASQHWCNHCKKHVSYKTLLSHRAKLKQLEAPSTSTSTTQRPVPTTSQLDLASIAISQNRCQKRRQPTSSRSPRKRQKPDSQPSPAPQPQQDSGISSSNMPPDLSSPMDVDDHPLTNDTSVAPPSCAFPPSLPSRRFSARIRLQRASKSRWQPTLDNLRERARLTPENSDNEMGDGEPGNLDQMQDEVYRGEDEDKRDEEDEDEDEEEDEGGQQIADDDEGDDNMQQETGNGNQDSSNTLDAIAVFAAAARERAAEESMRRAHDARANALDESDLCVLRPYVFKVEKHLTESGFSELPQTYPQVPHTSLNATKKRVGYLSGFDKLRYSCCINSCVCFVGPYADLTKCPYCSTDRFTPRGEPRKYFDYIPLIPHLKAMADNLNVAQSMQYRSTYTKNHKPGIIGDVFDGSHYRSLLTKPVRNHNFHHFSDDRDIALGLSTDGFGPHKKRKHTCWPIILINYNLPPKDRVKKKHIINIGTIPGPKKPQDWDSFCYPLAQELLELEEGVKAFDAISRCRFDQRAYLIFGFGDLPAIALVLRTKGQNGYAPCRICNIKGCRCPPAKTNYVPLNRDRVPNTTSYNASALPMRNHEEFLAQNKSVENASTKTEQKALAKEYGVKGTPLLSTLSSISFPSSFPLDFMHLIWENLIPNLISFWTAEFKELSHEGKDYVIAPAAWSAIGLVTGASGKTIPAAFGARVPNIDTQGYYMTAEMWSNWTLFIAPVVLRGRLHLTYYKHFMRLHSLLNLCLQLEFTEAELETIEEGFQNWVKDYEKLYYMNDPARLSACPLTIHSLLHIAWGIRVAGPVGGYWAYAMERHCNALLPAVRSRLHPYTAIANCVTAMAQINQIRLLFNVSLDLTPPPITNKNNPPFIHPSYPGYCLSTQKKKPVSKSIQDHIIRCLVTHYQPLEEEDSSSEGDSTSSGSDSGSDSDDSDSDDDSDSNNNSDSDNADDRSGSDDDSKGSSDDCNSSNNDDDDEASRGDKASMSDEGPGDSASETESESVKPITAKDLKAVLKLDSQEVLQFGRVKIGKDLETADSVIASDLVQRGERNRDTSYVKYNLFVDRHAHNSRPSSFAERSFFGQLKRIFLVNIPDIPEFGIQAETVILALVHEAKVKVNHKLHSYKKMGQHEVVDLAMLQCVIGRVHDRDRWYILDRT